MFPNRSLISPTDGAAGIFSYHLTRVSRIATTRDLCKYALWTEFQPKLALRHGRIFGLLSLRKKGEGNEHR